jgi:hypothetical protein
MPHEIVYQYSGKPHLRDAPEFDPSDTSPIPIKDQMVGRHGTNYRVVSVTQMKTLPGSIAGLATYLVDLEPLDEFPADSSD